MSATRTNPGKAKGRPASGRKQSPKRSPVLPIALGVFVLLAIIAVIASRGSGGDDGSTAGDNGSAAIEETRDVEVSGDPLPDYEQGSDAAVGQASPVVEGQTFDGASITIGNAGEPQLVFFVAHWCPHCQREVPVITDWIDEKGLPEGVTLKAVSTGLNRNAPNYPPSEWLDREGWPVKTLADDEESSTGAAFGLTGYPYFVAIDGEGKIVGRASGELEVDQLEALVEAARG